MKLKNCPFCGGEPEYGVETCETSKPNLEFTAVVRCRRCGVSKTRSFKAASRLGLVPFASFYFTFEDVQTDWNKRA